MTLNELVKLTMLWTTGPWETSRSRPCFRHAWIECQSMSGCSMVWRHVSTINRIVSYFLQIGRTADCARPGQHCIAKPNQDRYICLHHLRNPFKSATSTTRETICDHGRRISATTVRWRLKASGLKCQCPYHGPMLKRCHRAARMLWGNAHAGQSSTRVILSDESRFSLSRVDRRISIYRRPNACYSDSSIVERDRFSGGSAMGWDAIDHNFRSELIIRQNLTAQCYMDNVLNPFLLPLLYQHGHHLLFQQDNAHPHPA